jgi:hypothetical protein
MLLLTVSMSCLPIDFASPSGRLLDVFSRFGFAASPAYLSSHKATRVP